MGSTFDYVPVRLTKAFQEAQQDEKFQSWLKMQDAATSIQFAIDHLPAVRDAMFTGDSLDVVEATFVELFPDDRSAYASDDNIHRTMRFHFYIGETFRRAFDGTWVALPPDENRPTGLMPAIDLPFDEGFILPTTLIGFALNRRAGHEISFVFGRQSLRHTQWVEAGKPERVFRGTLREDT